MSEGTFYVSVTQLFLLRFELVRRYRCFVRAIVVKFIVTATLALLHSQLFTSFTLYKHALRLSTNHKHKPPLNSKRLLSYLKTQQNTCKAKSTAHGCYTSTSNIHYCSNLVLKHAWRVQVKGHKLNFKVKVKQNQSMCILE